MPDACIPGRITQPMSSVAGYDSATSAQKKKVIFWVLMFVLFAVTFVLDAPVMAQLRPLHDSHIAHVLRHTIRWLGVGYVHAAVALILLLIGLWLSDRRGSALIILVALCSVFTLDAWATAGRLITAVSALLLVWVAFTALSAKHRLAGAGAWALFAFLASGTLSSVLKVVIHRPRPWVSEAPPDAWIGYLSMNQFHSFPSGEATTTFALATVLGGHFPRLRVPLFVIAAVVAISRVLVGSHHPSDIWAGAMLGTGVGQVMNYLAILRQRKARAG